MDCGIRNGGCCSINEYQNPSYGVCLLSCQKNTDKPATKKAKKILGIGKSRGLGDTVKKIIGKITMGRAKQCGGCKKRQELLNRVVPYKDR